MHTFHIPVMGTAFTIDTPYKVAKYGISSVVSIGDDELCETMRHYYCQQHERPFEAVDKQDDIDYRAKRITAYLNLLHELIQEQVQDIKQQSFSPDSELTKYFELLPDDSESKQVYQAMLVEDNDAEKARLETKCRALVQPGAIDVNIMTKLDRVNYDQHNQPLPDAYSDAVSALRGFANSVIDAGIVFSAGFNRRLFAHCDKVDDFYLTSGRFKKRLILKVSDYRSSLIQGRFLAKKGVWVSEYRIESGLNCGGHAFATEGLLCGPILEEFKQKRHELDQECRTLCNQVLASKNRDLIPDTMASKVTYQGGIGTHQEQQFLLQHYHLDTTGWATPFLLVPEVTSLDMATRTVLQNATKEDCYLSGNSPLGVPFNTVKNTDSDRQKYDRVANGRPGSPCPKGHLVFDTEFSKKPVCKASVFYQKRKIAQLKALDLLSDAYNDAFDAIVEKSCLCEDLAAPALIEKGLDNQRPLKSAVCAGPNIAYYKKIVTLKEMVGHIYGRLNLIDDTARPSMFVAELTMYIHYLKQDLQKSAEKVSSIDIKRFSAFAKNLYDGIKYYIQLTSQHYQAPKAYTATMMNDFHQAKDALDSLVVEYQSIFSGMVPASPAVSTAS